MSYFLGPVKYDFSNFLENYGQYKTNFKKSRNNCLIYSRIKLFYVTLHVNHSGNGIADADKIATSTGQPVNFLPCNSTTLQYTALYSILLYCELVITDPNYPLHCNPLQCLAQTFKRHYCTLQPREQ